MAVAPAKLTTTPPGGTRHPDAGGVDTADPQGTSREIAQTEGYLWRGAALAPMIDAVSEEHPVALTYNGISHAVMMATPADLEDFALGFSLSEGILESPEELYDVEIEHTPRGDIVRARISARRFAALRDHRRNLTGRTGCGLCGVDSLEHAVRSLPPVEARLEVNVSAIRRAVEELPDRQLLNRTTRSLHAAAWADTKGAIHLAREDVGRHNALDKLIGALATDGVDTAGGFAVVTSRCSYEMVQKAATVGIPVLVAVSAPTALAVRMANSLNVAIVASARADSLKVYGHAVRISSAPRGDVPCTAESDGTRD